MRRCTEWQQSSVSNQSLRIIAIPITHALPKLIINTPPNTGSGIATNKAENLPRHPRTIINSPAINTTLRLPTWYENKNSCTCVSYTCDDDWRFKTSSVEIFIYGQEWELIKVLKTYFVENINIYLYLWQCVSRYHKIVVVSLLSNIHRDIEIKKNPIRYGLFWINNEVILMTSSDLNSKSCFFCLKRQKKLTKRIHLACKQLGKQTLNEGIAYMYMFSCGYEISHEKLMSYRILNSPCFHWNLNYPNGKQIIKWVYFTWHFTPLYLIISPACCEQVKSKVVFKV